MTRYSRSDVDMDLLEELFNETDFDVWRGEITHLYLPYDSFEEYLDGYTPEELNLTEKQFNATLDYLQDLLYDARYYSDDRVMYLELHDNHTIFDIASEIPEEAYWEIVDIAVDSFKEATGEEIFGLGRSGRHICIEYNLDNLIHYDEYKNVALEFEQQVIEEANNYI